MSDHDRLRQALGSYLLGALDPPDRAEVEAHLRSCAGCRDELASHAGLPGLLSRLSADEVLGGTLLPPPSLLPRILAAVEDDRASRRTRLRGWQIGTAAAVLAAAASIVVAVGPGPGGTAGTGLRPASGVLASGRVSLQGKAWGTALHLRLHLPPAPAYVAWAVDARGTRTQAASWSRVPSGDVQVDGATGLHPDELRQVVVASSDGTTLLSVQR